MGTRGKEGEVRVEVEAESGGGRPRERRDRRSVVKGGFGFLVRLFIGFLFALGGERGEAS